MIRRQSEFVHNNYLLKYKEDSEYVTLASLYLPTVEEHNRYNVHTIDEVKDLYSLIKESQIGRFINHNSIFDSWNSRTLERAKEKLNYDLNSLEQYINSEAIDLGINKDNWKNWGDRKGLLEHISGQRIDTAHYRYFRADDNFYVGNLFCIRNLGDRDRPKIRPVFTMVVKREYIKYVKLCYILGKQPKGEVFEFWITKDFDTPRTQDKYLRSHVYRKHIKPILLEKNIPIVEKDNWLDDIYKIVKQPVVKTLRDRKEWLNSISKDFTNYLNPQDEQVGNFPSSEVVNELSDYTNVVWQNPITPSQAYIAGVDPINSNREVVNGEGIMAQIRREDVRLIYNPDISREALQEWLNNNT